MMPPNSTAILYNYWESEMLPFYCRARSLFWTCLIWSSSSLFYMESLLKFLQRPGLHLTALFSILALHHHMVQAFPPLQRACWGITLSPLPDRFALPSFQSPPCTRTAYTPPPCLSTWHAPSSWPTHTLDITLQYLSSTFSSQLNLTPTMVLLSSPLCISSSSFSAYFLTMYCI